MTATLILPAQIAEQLLERAGANPTVEVCGLLGGHANRICHFYPVANVAAQPATCFLLDAAGQIDAMRHMRERGEDLRGIFHSHLLSPAIPSVTDRAEARYTDCYYLIVSLQQERSELTAHYYNGQRFRQVPIIPVLDNGAMESQHEGGVK